MERKAFLDQEPPPGYVAGVGRGASGFVTSANSARFESSFGTENSTAPDDAGLLAAAQDDEADRIYNELDQRMTRRRPQEKRALEVETGTGVIRPEFSLLKAGLAAVSADEWAALPDPGDITRKNKRQRLLDQQSQRTYAAPDTVIAGSRASALHGASGSKTLAGPNGLAPSAQSGLNVADSVGSGPETVTSVSVADIEQWEQSAAPDISRTRPILASLRASQPGKPSLWISSARLEELAHNYAKARLLIVEGCTRVPRSEEIWLESIRLHRSDLASCKRIVNDALRVNTYSEALWLRAVDLEHPGDIASRRKITMKALEYLPTNSALWQTLVDLEENETDRRKLLERAAELTSQWRFWLALVALLPYKEAKAVLNRARKLLPAEHRVWVAAVQLEERENPEVPPAKLLLMLTKAMKELSKATSQLEGQESAGKEKIRVETWLEEAAAAERDDFAKSCAAIVDAALPLLPEENRLSTLIGLAESYASRERITTSSAIYENITKLYPHDVSSWCALFSSLRKAGHLSRLYSFYERAIDLNQELVLFHLMYAKDKWIQGKDVPGARLILGKANSLLPSNEQIWLARIKLEVRSSQFENALSISSQSVQLSDLASPRVWYKHIHLLRFLHSQKKVPAKDIDEASEKALRLFPDNYKLYLQRSQFLLDQNDVKAARELLSIACRKCEDVPEIHIALAEIDISLGSPARARSVLDSALLINPKSDKIWERKIKLEREQKDMVTARQLVSKALKEVSDSPRIWILNLSMIQKLSHRKNAFLDALKLTNNASEILTAIGVFFWLEGKFSKAKTWFDRALTADSNNGDAWGWNYCFYTKMGLPDEEKRLLAQIEEKVDDINRGNTWISVAKAKENLNITPADCIKLVGEKLMLTTL